MLADTASPTHAHRHIACWGLVSIALACWSCGDKAATTGTTAAIAAKADSAVALTDVVSDDADTASVLDLGSGPDTVASVTCPGGAGCACTDNKSCDIGLCLDLPDGKKCAKQCVDSCPAGFACKALNLGGGDPINVCVSQFGLRCEPCAKSSECETTGTTGAACVSYGDAGNFCGSPCVTGIDCGAGFACSKVTTVEGSATKQCVKLADVGTGVGTCSCSARAAAQSLSTTCGVSYQTASGQGAVCKGQSACTVEGNPPTACDAPSPGTETCDNKDNNCDGKVDEGTCDDQNPCTQDVCSPGGGSDGCVHSPTSGGCDDGDPCTNGDVCAGGKCTAGSNLCACKQDIDCAGKEDGDLCNGTLVCDVSVLPFKCVVNAETVVACDLSGDTTCSQNQCDKASGKCAMMPGKDGVGCDDGEPCTAGDSCKAGTCAAGTQICGCMASADCGKLEDGDLCNGMLYCDKAKFPYACKINPVSVVACDLSSDTTCAQNVCTAATGTCAMKSAKNGTACEADGIKCTPDDSCQAGKCEVGTNICDCKTNADCANKEDGNACNGTLFCNKQKGVCQLNPSTVVTCPSVDDTACKKSACVAKSGQCVLGAINEGGGCDDGNACTAGEGCVAGSCSAGANICVCSKDSDCTGKDDGDLCNGTLYCNKGKATCEVNPATVVKCPIVDDTQCAVSTCAPKTGVCGLVNKATNTACDDGNSCTTGDVCAGGACQTGTNVCACKADGDCVVKEDGDVCNGTLFCNKATGSCQVNPATVVVCNAAGDTFCSKNQCDKVTGKCAVGYAHQGQPCDDGNLCTGGDFCKDGGCVAPVNVCVCKINADCEKFEDGDWCNGKMVCTPSGCQVDAASVVKCPGEGDTACSHNQCLVASGQCAMVAVNEGGACDDGEPCTKGDLCKAGGCAAGGNLCPCLVDLDCADGIACTTDLCGKALGCKHVGVDAKCEDGEVCTVGDCDLAQGCAQLSVQVTCTDGNACTAGDQCDTGKCVGKVKVVCDDKNGCTDDACDLAKGCTVTANAAGCDDGNLCTVKDGCKAGKCSGGGVLDCSDGNLCTTESCGGTTGCAYKVTDCGDGNVCTADSCDKGKGCGNSGAAGICDDGNSCTAGDVCDAGVGVCKAGKVQVPCDSGPCAPGKEEWWSKLVLSQGVNKNETLRSVTTAPNGGIVAAGTSFGKLSRSIAIRKFSVTGGSDFVRVFDHENGTATDGSAVLAVGELGFLVVGTGYTANGWVAFGKAIMTDQSGNAVWTYTTDDAYSFVRVVDAGGGLHKVIGVKGFGGAGVVMILSMGALGTVQVRARDKTT